jgi:hypothetical protein
MKPLFEFDEESDGPMSLAMPLTIAFGSALMGFCLGLLIGLAT